MEKIEKVLFAKRWAILSGVLVSAAGLIFIFANGYHSKWFAYPVYVLSACSFAAVCFYSRQAFTRTRKGVNALKVRFPVIGRYFSDVFFKMHISLYRSLALNVLYAAMKLGFGIHYRSAWFATLGIYYLLSAIMRFSLVHYVGRNEFGANRISEWKRYRLCGAILLIMSLVLTGEVIMIVRDNEGFQYAGYLIYIMAMYAFYSITTAIIDVVKFRKYSNPILSAAKAVQLAAATVSMLALETAMLNQFGEDEAFYGIMTAITGGGVCSIVLGIAVYMMIHANKKIGKEEQS